MENKWACDSNTSQMAMKHNRDLVSKCLEFIISACNIDFTVSVGFGYTQGKYNCCFSVLLDCVS